MNSSLYYKLIKFNKREPIKIGDTRIIGAKIYGGFGLRLMHISSNVKDISTHAKNITSNLKIINANLEGRAESENTTNQEVEEKPVDEDKFWKDLKDHVDTFDGDKKYIDELREEFSDHEIKDIFKGISKFYLKSGHVYNRKLINKRPTKLPLDTTIFYWSNNGNKYAKSNTPFLFSPRFSDFVDNVYYVESSDLIKKIILEKNKEILNKFTR